LIDPIEFLTSSFDDEATWRSIAMKNEYSRAIVVTGVLLGLFYFTMYFGLGFVFEGHVAALLAAIAAWSLAVFLATYPLRLPYRRGFCGGSNIGAVMMAFAIGHLIVGAKPHVLVPIAIMVLMLPVLAIGTLLERILFTDEERQEIKSQTTQVYRVP
jgi:hypothetical protein